MGYQRVTSLDAHPKLAVGAALTNGDYDGQIGIARFGTYPDVHEERFAWNTTEGRWIGHREHVMVRQSDTWGMDLSDRSLSSFRNAWTRFDSPLPYGKGRAALSGAITLPQTTISVYDIVSMGIDASGQIRMREQIITYGAIDTGTHQFTSCSGGTGSFPDGTIITQHGENLGGWGMDTAPLDRVGEMWAQGYRLQEKANAWLNGGRDNVSMSVAPYYYNHNIGTDWTLPAAWETGPPSGGLTLGLIITGPASPKLPSGIPNDPNRRTAERDFEFTTTGWTDWSGSSPTARVLYAAIYGRMDSASANDNGEVYGYTLRVRWVLDPV